MSFNHHNCRFISYRTGEYKLHYYETPTNIKLVMLTDTKTSNLRVVLHQIWANLYVEFVVRNPLSPTEHPGGVGVNNELFELGLDRFVVSLPRIVFPTSIMKLIRRRHKCLIQLCEPTARNGSSRNKHQPNTLMIGTATRLENVERI